MTNELPQLQLAGTADAAIRANMRSGTKVCGALGVCLFVFCIVEFAEDDVRVQEWGLLGVGAVILCLTLGAGVDRCMTRCTIDSNGQSSREETLSVNVMHDPVKEDERHVSFLDEKIGGDAIANDNPRFHSH